MGNILTFSPDALDDNQTQTEIKIQLDFKKPVHQEIKQLQHWSLE